MIYTQEEMEWIKALEDDFNRILTVSEREIMIKHRSMLLYDSALVDDILTLNGFPKGILSLPERVKYLVDTLKNKVIKI